MRNLVNTLIAILIITSLTSCEKTIIGTEVGNTPRENFELFWNDINEHYGLFQVRGHDWDSIYNQYNPQVTGSTTEDELWDIMVAMNEYLDDSHTFIYDRENQKIEVSGYESNMAAHEVFEANPFVSNYLENHRSLDPNDYFQSAKIMDKEIGYLYIGAMDGWDETLIDEVIKEHESKKAIIVDIRSNTGGDANFSRFLASRFSDGVHFTHTTEDKIGPGRDEFSEKTKWYSSVGGPRQFTKPIVVITNRATISAGEDFLTTMKSFGHVSQVGDITAGDFSNTSMHRFLPIGWEYRYSTQRTLLPDGSSLDGIGHVPEILVKNEMENVMTGEDKVIETALQYLTDRYGIN